MAKQPQGTVTLVFTDIEGSTRLLDELGEDAYRQALGEHRAVVRDAFARHSGYEVDYEGDAFFYAFASAHGAVSAVQDAMAGLEPGPIAIRVGVHTGEPGLDPPKYVGLDVHKAARVMSAGHGGQVLISQATHSLLGEGFSLSSLGDHRLKDIDGPVALYQLGSTLFPPLKTIANTNLPRPASSFVGREHETQEVVSGLRNGARLLTMTGPGGTGKTRLAIEAASELVADFANGVFWIGLATLRDSDLVTEQVALVLGAKDALSAHIADKELLLVLDNLEQVAACAPELSGLLEVCPRLRLLATSRELLRVRGEVEYAVPPLAEAESVELFAERAQLEPDDTVAELCRRLDNLPLALELAAARTSVLSPEQILERLSQRLDLLKGGRDAEARQQTLRATIEWSYDLLSDEEQRLFARLSIFTGGCTLEAAEEVCEAGLDPLQSLVEKSLVRRSGGRYWMLESIREFATERLSEAAEAETLSERHAQFFLALAEELEPPQMGISETTASRLLAEQDNLRSAIEFFVEHGQTTDELRLVGSLFRHWESSGLIVEGRARADHALAGSQEDEPRLRAKALYAASLCAFLQGDVEACAAYDEERLAIAEEIGDHAAIAAALSDLGTNAQVAGDRDRAAELLSASREHALQAGADETVWAVTANLATLELERGEHQRAIELLEPQLLAVRERGVVASAETMTCLPLGFALLQTGQVDRVAELFRDALRGSMRAGGPVYATTSLDGLAAVALETGDPARAARLLAAAERARADRGFRRDGVDARRSAATEEACRTALGDARWEATYAEGYAMPLEEAIEYALEHEPEDGGS